MPIVISTTEPTTLTIDAGESVFVDVDNERGAQIEVSAECKIVTDDPGYVIVRPGSAIKVWGLFKITSQTWVETAVTVTALTDVEAAAESDPVDVLVVVEAGGSCEVTLARDEVRRVHGVGNRTLEVSTSDTIRVSQHGAYVVAREHFPVRLSGLFKLVNNSRAVATVRISDVSEPKAAEEQALEAASE